MTKKESKTKVETNNEKEMVNATMEKEVKPGNNCPVSYKYEFKFDTMEEAVIFSALIYRKTCDLLVTVSGLINLEIVAAPASEILELYTNSRHLKHSTIHNFLENDSKYEPRVYINCNSTKKSKVVDRISKLLSSFHNDEQRLIDYLNGFETVFNNDIDYLIEVIGCTRFREFRKDFIQQKLLASCFRFNEKNTGAIAIAFVTPEESNHKDLRILDCSSQFLTHRFDDKFLKQYLTEYEYENGAFLRYCRYKANMI